MSIIYDKYFKELIKIRRKIHSNPELGFKEHQTALFIYNYLKKIGIKKIKKDVITTGVVALIEGKKDTKKTIAIRADMDALPITEETGATYASKRKGVMHACGHDGHIAILLVAARILYKMRKTLPGNIKLIFQPAEEMLGGGKKMVESGVLKDPEVDAIVALHLWMDFHTGEVGIKSGPVMAAMDKIDITVIGKESHGAMPHQGIDAITCISELILSLQTIISREIDPLEPAVLTFGQINGGSAYNILANQVDIKGTSRTFKKEIRDLILNKIKIKAEKITSSYNTEVAVDINPLYPVTYNSDYIINIIKNNPGDYKLKEFNKPFLSSEDFSYYLQEVPGVLLFVGAQNDDKNYTYPLHHSKFNFDEEALLVGLKVLVNTTKTLINENIEGGKK